MEVESIFEEDPVYVVHMKSARVSFPEVPHIKKEIQHLMASYPQKIILDLEKVNYLDSAALGMLFQLQNSIKKQNGQLLLTNINSTIEVVLNLTKSDRLLHIVDSVDEALRTVSA